MPHLRAFAILLCLLSLSLEPARTESPAAITEVPGGPRSLLRNLPESLVSRLISSYPQSFVDSELYAADTLIKRENYDEALVHLDNLLRIGPDKIAYMGKKAQVYQAMGRPELALPLLESIAAVRGDLPSRRALAEAYRESGDFVKAVAEYEKLLGSEADQDWVRQQIVSLTRQKLSAPVTTAVDGTLKIPEALLLIPPDSRCAIVEKDSQTVFLYRHTAGGIELEKAYACSTGAQPGEKSAQGDEKTPEGIYLPRTILPWTQLPVIYGKLAITLDYPNPFDLLQGKSGGGIWLHATNETIRAYLPNKTRGCVVVSNEDIDEIARLIELNRTPVVIASKIHYRTVAERDRELEELRRFLSEWRYCWENKRLDEYISMYSPRFRNGNQDVNVWRAVKESVFSRAGKITLEIELQSAICDRQYAVLTFLQIYHSDRLISRGTKRLFVVRENGAWKIIAEEMLL